jgi:ABC-type uncharacterized transport system substrate-binding protein
MAIPTAWADVNPGDMQIMARALSFMQKPLVGEVTVGIVYSPSNTQSAREAGVVRQLLSGGLQVGNLTLKSIPVPIGELAHAKVDIFFLTAGMDTEAQSVPAASRERQIPCVTTDLAQVRNGSCTMGIRSLPKIEIFVNRAAAAASGISFSTVFRMMITEL